MTDKVIDVVETLGQVFAAALERGAQILQKKQGGNKSLAFAPASLRSGKKEAAKAVATGKGGGTGSAAKTPAARLAASKRMKKYWAERRAEAAKGEEAAPKKAAKKARAAKKAAPKRSAKKKAAKTAAKKAAQPKRAAEGAALRKKAASGQTGPTAVKESPVRIVDPAKAPSPPPQQEEDNTADTAAFDKLLEDAVPGVPQSAVVS